MAATSSSPTSRRRRGLVTGVVAVVLVVAAGVLTYLVFFKDDPPPKLTLSTITTTTGAGGGTGAGNRAPLAGTWTVGSGSTAGYRVAEKLFGVNANTAVARTDQVTGTVTIDGTTVTKANLSVDMASMKSVGNKLDGAIADRRDGQFRGRIMNTDRYPTATFTLTKPIDLAPVPNDGVEAKYSATGRLTMHGTTKTVTIPLTAKRQGDVIAVQGILDVTFSDYGIDNPSGGPASVGDTGELEFLVQLEPSS